MWSRDTCCTSADNTNRSLDEQTQRQHRTMVSCLQASAQTPVTISSINFSLTRDSAQKTSRRSSEHTVPRKRLLNKQTASPVVVSSKTKSLPKNDMADNTTGSQDSTPGKWDIQYYAQTLNPPSSPQIYRFQSDINLSNASTTVGKQFGGFVGNAGMQNGQPLLHIRMNADEISTGKWNSAFADAMQRLSVLGIPAATANTFIDCTGALPAGTSSKRDIRAAPINDRIR